MANALSFRIIGDDASGSKAVGRFGKNLEDTARKAERAGKDIGKAGKSAGDELGKGLLSGISAADVAVVGALAGIGLSVGSAFTGALDIQAGVKKLQGQLGLTEQAADKSGQVASQIYGENWGASIDEVNTTIRAVGTNLVDLNTVSKQQLTSMARSAQVLADTFNVDVNQATRAAGQLMRTGLAKDSTAAFDIITRGYQLGIDRSDDFLDTLNEYTPHFQKLGIDGSYALSLLSAAMKAGARDSDGAADAIKEFAILAVDGSDRTAQGFQDAGLNAKEMAQRIATGGPVAEAAFSQTLKAIVSIEDPVKRDAAGVALLGAKWEDLGPTVVTAMANAKPVVEGLDGATKKLGDTVGNTLSGRIETLKRRFEGWASQLGQKSIPAVERVVSVAEEMATTFAGLPGPLQGAALGLTGLAVGGSVLLPRFKGMIEKVGELSAKFRDMSRAGKLATGALGAVGILLTIGAALLINYANKQADLKAKTHEFSGALDENSGALTRRNREMLISDLRASGAVDAAKKFGLTLNDLVRAETGHADAIKKVNDATAAASGETLNFGQSLLNPLKTLNPFSDKLTETGEAAKLVNDSVAEGSQIVKDAAGFWKEDAKALGEVAAESEALTPKQVELAKAEEEAANKAKMQADAMQALINKFTLFSAGVLSVEAAEDAFEKAVDDATASIKENGKSLEKNSEKGRGNRQALREIVSATNDVISARANQGASEKELKVLQEQGIGAFKRAAIAMGVSAEKAKVLAARYFGIPASRKTVLTADKQDAEAKIKALNKKLQGVHNKKTRAKIQAEVTAAKRDLARIIAQLKAIKSKAVNVRIDTWRTTHNQKGGPPLPTATGGWIRGPGTGTSDSIPRMLSNGEFVVRASQAQRFGPLLEAMNSGRKLSTPSGFARGEPMPFPHKGRVVGGGSGDVHFHFHGSVSSQRDAEDMMARALDSLARKRRLPSQIVTR